MPGPARAALAWSVFGWVAPQRLTCIAIFRARFQSAAPHGVTPCGVRQPQCQPCAGTTIAPPYRAPQCVALRRTSCRELQNLAHSDVSRRASHRAARSAARSAARRAARRVAPCDMPCLRGAALARHRACDVLRLATCRALRGAALTTCCVLQRVACCDVPSICYATPCDVRRPAMCDALRGAALATCCALQRVARCDVPDIGTRRPAMCAPYEATPYDMPRLRRVAPATCRALRCAGHWDASSYDVPRIAMRRALRRAVHRHTRHHHQHDGIAQNDAIEI